MRLRSSIVCMVMTASLWGGQTGFAEQDAGDELFATKVLPLLKQKCFQCHGAGTELKGDYNLTTREGLLKGGESGETSIIPGNPAESVLISAVKWEAYEMPPKENDKLSGEQINWLEQWIQAGAPWPTEETIALYRKKAP